MKNKQMIGHKRRHLTPLEQEVLKQTGLACESLGYSPTIREVAEAAHCSFGGAINAVANLHRAGLLTYVRKVHRSLRLTATGEAEL